MRIVSLYVEDFGILRHQALDGLEEGIVIIGGPNRAGKTTLLQVLRHLPFGFPRGGNLPPPRHEYHVEAEIVDGGHKYSLKLKGHGRPEVAAAGGSDVPVYGGIDPFTYHRLFTIDLDELSRRTGSDGQKLQSVLLGAGLADIARIPALRAELNGRANKIGGTAGRPNVGEFKNYHRAIRRAVREREAASGKVRAYSETLAELKQGRQRLQELEQSLKEAGSKVSRLDILKQNYDLYTRLVQLEESLERSPVKEDPQPAPGACEEAERLLERLAEKEEERDRAEAELAALARGENLGAVKAFLLEHAGTIRYLNEQVAGWKEKIAAYQRRREFHNQELHRLEREVTALEPSWSLGRLRAMRLDRRELDRLSRALNEKRLLTDLLRLRDRVGEVDGTDPASTLKPYFFASLLLVLAGVLIIMWQPMVGAILSVAGVAWGAVTALVRRSAQGEREKRRRDREEEYLRALSASGLDDAAISPGRLAKTEAVVASFCRDLDLEPEASGDLIRDRFMTAANLRDALRRWDDESGRLDDARREIDALLSEGAAAVRGLGLLPGAVGLHDAEQVFSAVRDAARWLELALKLAEIEREIANIHGRMAALLGDPSLGAHAAVSGARDLLERTRLYRDFQKVLAERDETARRIVHSFTDRALEAFGLGEGATDAAVFKALEALYQDYASREEVSRAMSRAVENRKVLEEEVASLRESLGHLSDELKLHESSSDLEKAQAEIDEARRGLEPLARRYAVHRLAAFLLGEIEREFLAKAKDELLRGAGEIIRDITGGEISAVIPPEDLTQNDFGVESDGERIMGTESLSRGTREQVFLAVRLSRIRDIAPPLPVVVDDSLVNFDSAHLRQAAKALSNLARTHQVFVLTCHPETLDYLQGEGANIQFWRIDRGAIERSDYRDLRKFLGS